MPLTFDNGQAENVFERGGPCHKIMLTRDFLGGSQFAILEYCKYCMACILTRQVFWRGGYKSLFESLVETDPN